MKNPLWKNTLLTLASNFGWSSNVVCGAQVYSNKELWASGPISECLPQVKFPPIEIKLLLRPHLINYLLIRLQLKLFFSTHINLSRFPHTRPNMFWGYMFFFRLKTSPNTSKHPNCLKTLIQTQLCVFCEMLDVFRCFESMCFVGKMF